MHLSLLTTRSWHSAVQKVGSTIHRINFYPVDSAIDFLTPIRLIMIYSVDSAIQPGLD